MHLCDVYAAIASKANSAAVRGETRFRVAGACAYDPKRTSQPKVLN
jgi:hypothetical protein